MAWDKTKPAAVDILSDSQADIAGNFAAIEEGDTTLQYDALNVEQQGSDPGALASNVVLYSKAGTTYPSLFAQNSNGDVIPLTDDDHIGATTTKYKMDSFTFDGTTVYNENNVAVAWARVTSANPPVISADFNLGTISDWDNSVKTYKMRFDTTMSNANYAIMVQPFSRGTWLIQNVNTSGFDLSFYDDASTTTKSRRNFSCVVFGGL